MILTQLTPLLLANFIVVALMSLLMIWAYGYDGWKKMHKTDAWVICFTGYGVINLVLTIIGILI